MSLNQNQKLKPVPMLIVDDDDVTLKLLQEVFASSVGEGFPQCPVQIASSAETALAALKKKSFGIVLSDIRMFEMSGLELLREIKKISPETVVILMTAFGSMEGAIEAIQKGAFDYISKPFKIVDLKVLVQRALKQWNAHASSGPQPLGIPQPKPKTLIGRSPQIVEVYKSIGRASLSTSSVLITGESGTGKELVARAIHQNSSRRSKGFVAVNCGALAETLLESELFGHIRGSFTGANVDKKGLFEEAHLGTLFLDEIGDISAALQIKLLRVLQESEFKPVGSNETKKVDIRLIAATHRDLDALVSEGKFREDLFYRLRVIQIHLPPLRERIEDLDELVGIFLASYSEKNKKPVSHVSEDAMKRLKAYSWPGNVRELEHAIERAVAMTSSNILYAEDFSEIQEGKSAGPGAPRLQTDPTLSLEEIEKLHILKVLEQVNFNRSRASEILGIDRATLYRKAQKYGLTLGEKE